MGVFRRKDNQTLPSSLRAKVKRKTSVEKARRLSDPTHNHGFDAEKWLPTLSPGPEVVEADLDLDDSKPSIKAREFSAWTPGGQQGMPDGSEYRIAAPPPPPPPPLPPLRTPFNFVITDPGTPTVPIPKPRARTSKDPYAKRKAKFEQKPKLAPITETDSQRSSQISSASSNRNSDSTKVQEVIDEPMPTPSGDVLGAGNDSIHEESPNMVDEPGDSTYLQEEDVSDDPIPDVVTAREIATDPMEPSEFSQHDPDLLDLPDVVTFREIATDPMEPSEFSQHDPNLLEDGTSIYENVVVRPDGSMESLADQFPIMRLPLTEEEKPPLPERDFNIKPDPGPEYANISDHVKSNYHDTLPRGIMSEQNMLISPTSTLKKAYNVDDIATETKETAVGPDSSEDLGMDNHAFQYDDDFTLDIETVTSLLDEVVFGKGCSTQTGDSLRLTSERSTLLLQQMNHMSTRPISDCVVIDSGTSMDDLNPGPHRPVVLRHPLKNQNQQINRSIEEINHLSEDVSGSRDSLRTLEPPPLASPKVPDGVRSENTDSILSSFSDEVPKRRNGKMCVGMSIIFIVIILGIISAGVIVFFVVSKMRPQSGLDQSLKDYYLGIRLKGDGSQLKDPTSDYYADVSTNICTYVKQSFENTILGKAYKSCKIMDYRYSGIGTPATVSIAAHVKLIFYKEELDHREKADNSPVSNTMKFYLYKSLNESMSDEIVQFRDHYKAELKSITVVEYWNQLSDYGDTSGRRR